MFNGFFYWRLINMGINRKQKHASIRGFAFRRLKSFSIIYLIPDTNSDNSSSDNLSSDNLKICKKKLQACKPNSVLLAEPSSFIFVPNHSGHFSCLPSGIGRATLTIPFRVRIPVYMAFQPAGFIPDVCFHT